MKQKIVIRVPTNGQKSCSKAMKIVVSLPGVESVALKGDDKGQIEITGEHIDPVELTAKLRRKMGLAELLSVSEIKKEEKKDEKPKEVAQDPRYIWAYTPGPYQPYFWEPRKKLMNQVDPVSEIRKEKIKKNKKPKVEKPKDGPRDPPYFWAYGQGPYGCYVDPEPTTQYQDNSCSMYQPIRQSWMRVMDRPIKRWDGSWANPLAGRSRWVTKRSGLIHPNTHPYVRANTHLRFK